MKILIADDHELFLKGLEFILADMNDDVTTYLAKSYTEVFGILEKERDFDLILTDLAMPGASWNYGIEHINQLAPHTPIIIISAVFEPRVVSKTVETGVSGFIHKTSSNDEIKTAIKIVLSGGSYVPPELLVDETKKNLSLTNDIKVIDYENEYNFSQRQLDVLNFISRGLSNKQIAFELGITEGTVKSYVTEIFKKLNVFNRTAALIEVKRKGLIE
ncbi:MAG: response regulator transcription factor [Lactobacillaceae bacterium]|jgi:DNA-binding NarL/FixJ family response regulator|nr:response regulator transcription factor [Lactobacillaceae bacterium]